MSRSSDGYYRSGPKRRSNDGYGGGFSDYANSYGSRRSSRDSYSHDRRSNRGGRSHGGRGLMVNPWEGGVVPGSGGGRGAGVPISGDIVASINQLSRMDNPESELALNILNAVLSKEDSGWGGGRGRDWEGQSHKRRMDWDNQYNYESLGDGMLPTPHVPPRKMPRRDASYGTSYSWGVVGGFAAQPIRGKGRRGTKKTVVSTKKPNVATTKKPRPTTTTTTKTMKTTEKSKTAKTDDEAKEGEEKKEKTEGEDEKKEEKEGEEGEKKEEGEGKDAEAKGKDAEGGEAADGDAKAPEKKVTAKEKKKEENPVPVSYLRCHLCQMNKFNSSSNFMDHIRSKKHRRMIGYYGEKIAATEKLLKAQSWLKSQRNIVSMVKQKGKITRCVCCECPIKGGRWTHIHIREHMLLFHFTKCFTCKLKFMNRSDLEQHKLTTAHMKAQYALDQSAKERYQRWVSKTQKESNIPELSKRGEHSEDFHETVKLMFMNNLDTQAWNKDTIPIYDPARPAGMNHLVKHSQYVCTVCPQKVSQTAWEAKEHCKTQDHYDHFVKYLKDMEEKAAQKEKGDASDKENDEGEANAKKDEDGKTETKKGEEKEGEKEDKKEESATAKEEEEEEEEEEHEEDEEGGEEEEEEEEQGEEEEEENGMKDMENMEVIDEEGDHDGNEDEEDEEEEEEEEEEGGEEVAEIEEVGEDMDEIGEDLEEMGEEEEEEEQGEGEEEEEEEEEEKADTEDKTSSSSTTTRAAKAPAAPQPAQPTQARSRSGRIIKESRRGKD